MTDPVVIELLTAIVNELKALNAAQKTPRRLSHQDHIALDSLLPALLGKYGAGCVFTVNEIMQDSVFQALLAGMDARGVGSLLSNACGVDIAGLRVFKSEGRDHNATYWGIDTSP